MGSHSSRGLRYPTMSDMGMVVWLAMNLRVSTISASTSALVKEFICSRRVHREERVGGWGGGGGGGRAGAGARADAEGILWESRSSRRILGHSGSIERKPAVAHPQVPHGVVCNLVTHVIQLLG